MHPWIDWLLSNPVVGVVTWAGSILAIVGLAVTIFQSFKARRAAEHAEAAVSRLRVQIDSANIAYASAELSSFLHIVRAKDYALAQAFFTPLKRSLRLQCQSDASRLGEVEALNRAMGAIDKHLDFARSGDPRFKEPAIYRAVDGLLEASTRWESILTRSSHQG